MTKKAHTALCVSLCVYVCVCGVQEGSTKLWNGKLYWKMESNSSFFKPSPTCAGGRQGWVPQGGGCWKGSLTLAAIGLGKVKGWEECVFSLWAALAYSQPHLHREIGAVSSAGRASCGCAAAWRDAPAAAVVGSPQSYSGLSAHTLFGAGGQERGDNVMGDCQRGKGPWGHFG